MIRINTNYMRQAQPRRCINITPEVEVSPPMGTPEYDEWKKDYDIKWAEYKKREEAEKKLIAEEIKKEKEKEKADLV